MPLTPLIAIHMSAALAAIALGPLALRAPLGARPRPRLHRAAGYAWVTLMLVTALSASFIDAGGFTLLPGRCLGDLVLGQWLGLV